MNKQKTKPQPDARGVIAPPVVIYLVALTIASAIHFVWPLPITPVAIAQTIGWVLIVAGTAGIGWAMYTMQRARTNINPYKPATVLLTEGPFAFSRNPIYVGMTIIYVGIAFAANSLWPFILFPPLIEIMKWGVISREERHLEQKFGETYRKYMLKVRRWF